MHATLSRSERRAVSRDDARANPIPPREPSHGLVGEIVHQRHPMRLPFAGTCSGQRRVNAKREARREFWAEERRTVLVRISAQMEPTFREILPSLGEGARIDGCTPVESRFALDLAVHVPGAPSDAVEAVMGVTGYYNPDGSLISARLETVEWLDADGQRIGAN